MSETDKVYGIRSDLHAREALAAEHLEIMRSGRFLGLFDLGDVEATYIDENHPLRAGQTRTEQTMHAIIRNAVVPGGSGKLTQAGREAIDGTLASVEQMLEHVREISSLDADYRGIAGNSFEAWANIFGRIANPVQHSRVVDVFTHFEDEKKNMMREAAVEFYCDGKLYTNEQFYAAEVRPIPKSAVVYLPWKAHETFVRGVLLGLRNHDLQKIVILSHDYLTKGSLDPSYADEIKPMQNEEQVVTVLDFVAGLDAEVIGYFGHIGLQYGPSENRFMHRKKQITAYHTDERDGRLLELRLD